VVAENLRMRPLRLFLVENHADTTKYMQLFLEQLNYDIRVAPDMATALRDIPNSQCDVLISDIGLPDGDGWQLLEKLGSNRPPIAIAMSGYGTGNDQQKSHAVGYSHHLIKPFTPEVLLAILHDAEKLRGNQT
jgi:DNA-binding response OmpR family regulator